MKTALTCTTCYTELASGPVGHATMAYFEVVASKHACPGAPQIGGGVGMAPPGPGLAFETWGGPPVPDCCMLTVVGGERKAGAAVDCTTCGQKWTWQEVPPRWQRDGAGPLPPG